MHMREQVADFRKLSTKLMVTLAVVLFLGLTEAQGFQFKESSNGIIEPFKLVGARLSEFTKGYARLTKTPISVDGTIEQDLKGRVTLFLRKPINREILKEIFYRVLYENGYTVIDAPAGNGWIIQRLRDARDSPIPVYQISETPDTARLVTVYMNLKNVYSEGVARYLRSFMPINSRIIPASPSVLMITDTGSNIIKLRSMIKRLDTKEAAEFEESEVDRVPQKSCDETRIQKLVVENLEINSDDLQFPGANKRKGGSR